VAFSSTEFFRVRWNPAPPLVRQQSQPRGFTVQAFAALPRRRGPCGVFACSLSCSSCPPDAPPVGMCRSSRGPAGDHRLLENHQRPRWNRWRMYCIGVSALWGTSESKSTCCPLRFLPTMAGTVCTLECAKKEKALHIVWYADDLFLDKRRLVKSIHSVKWYFLNIATSRRTEAPKSPSVQPASCTIRLNHNIRALLNLTHGGHMVLPY
jgi:hypothetical protein